MWCSLERELQLEPNQVLLDPKEEPLEVVEQPQVEEQRVETTTQVETPKEGRKRTREYDILLHDARENVGAPTSQCRQGRSLDMYTRYMDLMSRCVVTEPSSFEEAV